MQPLTADQQQLVAGHYDLALRQARAFVKQNNLGHLADELESAALLGVCRAAHYHKGINGAKFPTFAYLCVKTEMLQVIRVQGRTERAFLEHAHEFLEHLGLRMHKSFDADEDRHVIDWSRPATDDLDAAVMAADLRHLVAMLPEVERDAIRFRYVEDEPIGGCGKGTLAAKKSRFFRAHNDALRRLRRAWTQRAVGRERKLRPAWRPSERPRRFMPIEPTITRSDLLAIRARVEQEFQDRLSDIDAALRIFDSGILETIAREREMRAPLTPVPTIPAKPRARPLERGSIARRVADAVKSMPEQFTRRELIAAVENATGLQVNPGSLGIALEQLERKAKIRMVRRGGRGPHNPTVYERLDMNGHAPADGAEFPEEAA